MDTKTINLDLLKSLSSDEPIWLEIHHGLSRFVEYPIQFSITNPRGYGQGVKKTVFSKIILGMLSGKLSEEATVDAITAFSRHCSKEQWEGWYRPILEHNLRLPNLTVTEFNSVCPREHRIKNLSAPVFSKIKPDTTLSGIAKFIIEGYHSYPRLFVFMRDGKIEILTEDGTPVHRMLPKSINRASGHPVVLEMYDAGDKYIVRDIILWEHFFNPKGMYTPIEIRFKVLEMMFSDTESIEIVEHINCDDISSVRDDISVLFQAGYDGIIIRPHGLGYYHPQNNIFVKPTRRSVLKCTDIVEATTGKYTGVAEYIVGKGTINKKSFESPVYHGLTYDNRELCLQHKDDYIGKKFDVVSCGLDNTGKLIFPIFKQWKKV